MNVINDEADYYFENIADFVLFENASDSEINTIHLPKKKYTDETVAFVYTFYKKNFRVDLKNTAVVYYESAVFDFINDYLQNDMAKCRQSLQLSLYLGYTKLSGMLLLFEHFIPL